MSDFRNLNSLRPGESRVVDGKLWGRCSGCGKIKRADGFFGGLHLCVPK